MQKQKAKPSKREQIDRLQKSIEKFGDYDGSKARKIAKIQGRTSK